MLQGILTEEEQNIMRTFDPEDLPGFARRCEEVQELVYTRLKRKGERIREYGTLEVFLHENGYDEV